MYSLFVDTHYLNLVVILYKDGIVVDKIELINIRNQSEYLVPNIKKILDNHQITTHDLSEIIVVNGPGSFTGVRIGVTVCKGIAYLNQVKIKVMSSLQVLASNIDSSDFQVSIPENNGIFVGIFKNDFINPEYIYVKKESMDTYVTNNIITNVESIDYQQVFTKAKELPYINPHLVNPLYIKNIEVKNDKKTVTNWCFKN